MTEREYIDATNLAKIRAAKVIVRDVLAMTPDEHEQQRTALIALSQLEDRLTKVVKTQG